MFEYRHLGLDVEIWWIVWVLRNPEKWVFAIWTIKYDFWVFRDFQQGDRNLGSRCFRKSFLSDYRETAISATSYTNQTGPKPKVGTPRVPAPGRCITVIGPSRRFSYLNREYNLL